MALSSLTLRDFVGPAIHGGNYKDLSKADRQYRSSFVKSVAELMVKRGESKNLDSAKRTVQRRITDAGQKRGASNAVTKTERSASRKFFNENPIVKKDVEGKELRPQDRNYRLATEAFKNKEDAERRLDKWEKAIANRKAGDSPTLIDHAKEADIKFVPEGEKYAVGPERNASMETAGAGGRWIATLRGD